MPVHRPADQSEEIRLWATARLYAVRRAPYLATALLALEPLVVEPGEDGRPAAGDLRAFPADTVWHVHVHPDALRNTETAEVAFWLLHQVTHLLRRHADRSPAAGIEEPARQWNLAADAEINDDLRFPGIPYPADAVTPHTLGLPDNGTAEAYWSALRQRDEEGPTGVDCGSGCGGTPRPWESGLGGLGRLGREVVARATAERIREHRTGRGEVPGAWERWADDVLKPAAVPWRRYLSSALRRAMADVAGRTDFTYRRVSRRSVPNVVLPALRQPAPRVAVVLDTSASVSDEALATALAEVDGTLRSLGTGARELRLICCDTRAYEAQRIVSARDLHLLGGGGTDMRAGIRAALALRPRPDVIIALTDGHTPWPEEQPPPGVRVVVALLDPLGSSPDWATVVVVEPEGDGEP